MTGPVSTLGPGAWTRWRIARWALVVTLLLTPLAMMQVSDEWHWGVGDFAAAATAIGGTMLLYERAERASGSRAYRAGTAIALAASVLTVWSTVVRDDGNGIGFFLLVLAAAVGAFAASFRAAGLARAMFGVAVMQALLGIALATAPSTVEPSRIVAASGFFVVLWLISAALFRAAAR